MSEVTFRIPFNRIQDFDNYFHNSINCIHMRYGQAFHVYFELHKITSKSNKEFCDKLFNAPNYDEAKKMVESITEFEEIPL